VPREHGLGPHQKAAPALAREQAAQRGKDEPVATLEARFAFLAVNNLELVPQHQDLDVLGVDGADPLNDSSEGYSADKVRERNQLIILLGNIRKEETIRGS
jgi:hypothetical protein